MEFDENKKLFKHCPLIKNSFDYIPPTPPPPPFLKQHP